MASRRASCASSRPATASWSSEFVTEPYEFRRAKPADYDAIIFFAFAASQGRRRVSAITGAVNAPAIAFHERMGFTVRGPIAGYNGPGTNLVVFERALDPPAKRSV